MCQSPKRAPPRGHSRLREVPFLSGIRAESAAWFIILVRVGLVAWLLGWLAFWGLVFETDFMQPKVHLELLIPASSFQVVSKQECVIMNISLSF